MPTDKRKLMIDKLNNELSISKQCQLLSVNRSNFYYTGSSESAENLAIMDVLDKQYLLTPFYGKQKLLPLLQELGYSINIKRLRRLCKLVNWRTIYPQKRTTMSDPKAYKYPYLLKDLEVTKSNQVWANDITYIPLKNGFMYLFAIIDLHTRYVVGWSLSNTMTAEWCIEAIKEAIDKHGTPEIINSDQGSQFTSFEYVSLLKDNNIKISMDGKGRALDNIYIERLWRSVKYENVYLYVYTDGLSLWKGLDAYFEFYNNVRLHESLDFKPPVKFYKSAS